MKVCVIAGEASGDLIGAEICYELKKIGAEIYGIGGEKMLSSGLKESFFDFSEISVMGFAEVLPKIFKIKALIKQTAKQILEINPDYIITIDSPGFNVRLVKMLKKQGFKGKLYHCVAPTVWAYKPKRAKVFASIFHKLFCILPFEPDFFLKEGLDAKFICYPPLKRLEKEFQEAESLPSEYIIFSTGSRSFEVSKNIKFAKKVIKLIKNELPDLKFVFPTFKRFESILKQNFPTEIIVTTEEEKLFYLKRAKFAISKSGTGAMENSLLKIPSIVFYNANPISVFIIGKMAQIKFMHLINIMLKREAIPEFIQAYKNPEAVALKVIETLNNPNLILVQKQAIEKVIEMLNSKEYSSFGEGVVKNL